MVYEMRFIIKIYTIKGAQKGQKQKQKANKKQNKAISNI